MGTTVNLNAVNYIIPATGEGNWGSQVTAYLVALSTGVLQKAGGSFTLTADVDYGATFGLKAAYFSARSAGASAGFIRAANNTSVAWRNAANLADLNLKVNASNILEFNGNPLVTLALGAADTVLRMNAGASAYEFSKLVNANIDAAAGIVYSKLNLATSIVNADINASAAIAYSKLNLSTSIVNADIAAAAAIAVSKLAATTASRALVSDVSGFLTAATTTATEIGFVNGVTSAIQTQINTKAATAGDTFTGNVIIDNEKEIRFREATANGVNYIAFKAPSTLAGDVTFVLPIADGSANQVLKTDGSSNLGWISPLTNPMTAASDLIIGGSGGTATRLPTNKLGRIQAEYTTATATMTIATPGVVTYTSHGRVTGDTCYFTTSGALPTGLAVDTRYWINRVDANTFNLSTSLANLVAGTYIATSGSQSGTHTIYVGGLGNTEFDQASVSGNTPGTGEIGELVAAAGSGANTTNLADGVSAEIGAGNRRITLSKGIYTVFFGGDSTPSDQTYRLRMSLAVQSGAATLTTLSSNDSSIQPDSAGSITGFTMIFYVIVTTTSTVIRVDGLINGATTTGTRVNNFYAIRSF